MSLRKKSNPIEDSLIRKGKVGSGKTEETFSPSESLYRALFDSGPQSMVLIGPDGRIRAFNENAAREVQEMRGCFYEIGRPLTDYVGEKYVSVFNERFQKALQGEIIRLERTVTDRAGVERWFEFSYHPVFDEQKKIIGVCLASASIEGRKRAEEALRVSESNLKALFDSSSESLVFIGSDGRIQAFNKNAAAAGREVQGLEYKIGRPFIDYIHPTDRIIVEERHRKVLDGESIYFDRPYIGIDGVEHWYEVRYQPIRDEQELIIGICMSTLCIDDRNKYEMTIFENQDRFQRFAEVTQEGIMIHDQGVVVDVNQALASLMGYEASEMIGKSGFSFLDPASIETARKHEEANPSPYEVKAQRKDGTTFPAELVGRNYKYKGRLLRVLGINNITERKKAEEALKQSEQDLKAVFNNTFQNLILIDRDGNIRAFNRNAAVDIKENSGKDLREGRSLFEYVQPGNRELLGSNLARALKGEAVQLEKVYRMVDGMDHWYELNYHPVFGELGEIDGICLTSIRIDDRKKSAEALQKSEATLRAVFNSGSQMIALIGKNGRLLDYNKSAAFNYEKIMGKKLESGKPFIDYVEPENKEFFRERFNRVLKGEFITLERSAKAVDGIEHWLEFTYNPVFDATGAITGMCMTGVLIDERKKGEEALRQSEEKFRKIFEDTSLGMAMVSDYRFIKVNRAFQVLLGYSEEELIGKTLFEITHPDDLVKSREIATKVHNAEKEIFKIEKRYIRKNGDSLWANVSGTLIRDGAGKKLYSLIMVENITERKKAQAALQKSEADLRAVFNSGSQVTVLITRDGRIQGFNKSAEVMAPHVLGRALEPGMFFAETLPQGASQEMFRSSFEAALEGRETKGERSIRAADGQARWVEVNYKPVINDHGGVDGVCFSLAFIDDRKKAERAIRESEEKFRKIFEDTSLGMSLVDRNFRFTHVNQAFCDLLGYTREEMIQISFKEITHPDDLPRNVAFSEDVKSGKGFQMQKRYLHKNDAVVWVNLTVTSFLDAQGELLYSLGMVENITEQKQSQEALQKSEAALKAVFNSGSQMVVLIGKDGRILDFNKNAEIQIEKVINLKFERGKLFNDYLLPQFKRVVQERLDRVLKGEFITVERPIRETDGIEHWFELAFNPVFDSQGLIAGVCLAAMPIDERRKVQEALQESEERYRRLVESSPEALLVHGEGRIIYMNPSGIKLLGASRLEELTGKSVLDIVHPHYRELVIARLRKLDQEGGLNESLEQKFVRLDGQVIDVEVKGIPFVYQGKPAGLALIRDITERKKAQATVLRYERLAGIGQVIAGIAHDIRNPLAVLSAMTQNIKERFGVSGSQSKEIEMIISQTERLKHFMNDILDYSKGLSLTKERIKPKYLLEQSLRLVKAQIGVDYEKIEVKWNSKEPLPDFSGDHDRLEQVLLNLLLNAYQAMEQGGTLTLILESQPGWMILKVEDDGPGIREADLTHLFEPFFTTKKHGSGLGLSLSQKIVEAHGGRIEVQKIVPHGTQFTLYLPL